MRKVLFHFHFEVIHLHFARHKTTAIALLTLLCCFSKSFAQLEHDGVSVLALQEDGLIEPGLPIAPLNSTLDGETYEIKVLFLYSEEALNSKSGQAGVEEYVSQIVARANLIFSNSNLNLVVTSVGLQESPILETSDAPVLLSLLAQNTEVQELRDSYEADVVSFLISHTSNNQHCGNAYILDKMDTNSSNFAFQIVSLNAVCEPWVFAHELGHNLGAEHDQDNANPGLFSNSYGFRFQIGPTFYRTVMAFEPGTLIDYFSSPDLSYQDVALGNENANNKATIEQSMAFVAGFRGSSTVSEDPEIEFSLKRSKKRCLLRTSITNLSDNSSLSLYRKKGKSGSKLLRTNEEPQSSDNFKVKRARRNRKYFVTYRIADQDFSSRTLTCIKKTQ